MSRTPTPAAILDLPDLPARAALRAGLMAMRVPPGTLPSDRRARDAVLRQLGDHPETVVFIDISRSGPSMRPTLLQLDSQIPPGECRRRVFLTRLAGGHVSDSDRNWVRSLGFAHLFFEFDANDCEGELRTALDAVAAVLSIPTIAPAELQRYARALKKERSAVSPRALIRAVTGLSAEALAAELEKSLDIQDRSYRLQTYPKCFLGSDAVAWIARRCRRSIPDAVTIGQALGTLGLLVHVAQEHPLLDEPLFYRMAVSPAVDRLGLAGVWHGLRGKDGVAIADRSYLGTTYPRCWIGSDAVTKLCMQHTLARHEAWIVLHRLMQLGLFEHVTQSRLFIDGTFFYRFTGLPSNGASP